MYRLTCIGLFILKYPTPFLAWGIAINIITFILYAADKIKAKKKKWRIPESTLLLLSAVGGGAGAVLGMYLFRHKTLHKKFIICVPLFFMLYTLFFFICIISALMA